MSKNDCKMLSESEPYVFTASTSKSRETGCPICLNVQIINEAHVEPCLHSFCFNCIDAWSRIGSSCPLCKGPLKTVVCNMNAATLFSRHEVGLIHQDSASESSNTRGIMFRRDIYIKSLFGQTPYSSLVQKTPTYYSHGRGVADLGPIRIWVEREMDVLLSDIDSSVLVELILSALCRLSTAADIANVLSPYLGRSTEHFVHELNTYRQLPSPLPSLERFDKLVRYFPRSACDKLENGISHHVTPITIIDSLSSCENYTSSSVPNGIHHVDLTMASECLDHPAPVCIDLDNELLLIER